MPTLKQLERTMRKANVAYYAAEAKQRDKDNARLLGKCFKYNNSGGGCDERWWLYAKVIAVKDGSLRLFQFERRPNGITEIDPDRHTWTGHIINGGYHAIDVFEFNAAWIALKAAIVQLDAVHG